MLQRYLEFDRRMRRLFYDGPAVLNYPGRRMEGYRSPTVLLGYWTYAFVVACFTFPGRLLLAVWVAVFLAGMTALIMPGYYLTFALSSLFFCNIVVGWLARPRLRVERQVGGPIPAGAPLRLDYRIRNEGRRYAWDLMVDSIPYPTDIVFDSPRHVLEALAPGEEVRLHSVLRARRRGRYDLPLPVVSSAFPFGLWRWGSHGPPSHPLLVYPRFRPLDNLRVPQGFNYPLGGEVPASRPSESTDFMGCREYRYGDNPRRLHALSSARLRIPVVKEFHEEEKYRAAVIVDNFLPKFGGFGFFGGDERERLDALLALTAAVSEFLLRRQYLLDLFVPGAHNYHLPAGQGQAQLEAIFAAIAELRPCRGEAFQGPSDDLCFEIVEINSAVFLALAWDEPRQRFVSQLRHYGVTVKVIVVNPAEVAFDAGSECDVALRPGAAAGGQIVEL